MKKAILPLTALCIFCTLLKAQTKPEAKPQAPIYSPDLNSKHDVTLKGITLQQLNDWVIYASNGPEAINNSTQISAKQATDITKNYQTVSLLLKAQLDDLLAEDKAKWQADTAKKVKSTKK